LRPRDEPGDYQVRRLHDCTPAAEERDHQQHETERPSTTTLDDNGAHDSEERADLPERPASCPEHCYRRSV